MNLKAFLNTISTRNHSLPIAILYVTEGCNLQCITCSYRNPLPNELSLDEICLLADSLARNGLRHIVYSGGEPLMRRDFPEICKAFENHGVKQTLLTNGLLLQKRFDEIRHFMSETIVSVDGASAETHNAIRGLPSFDIIRTGIEKAVACSPRPIISIRTVLQRKNFRELPQLVEMAKFLGVSRISFLAADLLSDSFGRDTRGIPAPNDSIGLSADEVLELFSIIHSMERTYSGDFSSNFISQSPEGLMHIARYYEALCSTNRSFPRNYCNAPMVSAVITATGEVQPCFFLPSIGSIRSTSIPAILGSEQASKVRRDVKRYALDRCQTCVCTLQVQPVSALLDRF